MRPVPRNIDKPNRMVEFVVTFMISYFGSMIAFNSPLISFTLSGGMVYTIHKLTTDKPEGAAFRLWYRFAKIGHFFPNPKKVKKFEV